jgi:metallo-beta-lactamase family protein
MLEDSLRLLTREAEGNNPPAGGDPIYSEADVKKTFDLWKTLPYHEKKELFDGLSVFLKNSGHVLGSSMFEFTYENPEDQSKKKIVFTGDLGNSPSPLLSDAEIVDDADYLIMESVYGDRLHESADKRKDLLEDVIENTVNTGGTLLIPAFSLEKTQMLIFEINSLVEKKKIPSVPVFVDSPLAVKLTEIYKKYSKDFKYEVRDEIKKGDDIFQFPKLHFVGDAEESKAIKNISGPKIIIAGSGMSTGGRIVHHEINYLGDSRSTILFIGYQVAGSLGRQIQDGAKQVKIYGNIVDVNARIETITGYSSHRDSAGLFDFASYTADRVKKIFVTMGEPKSAMFLVQRLRDYLGIDAIAPNRGEVINLD